jgi:hypothetical protein
VNIPRKQRPAIAPFVAFVVYSWILSGAVHAQESNIENDASEPMGFVEFFRGLVVENRETYENQRLGLYEGLCAHHGLDPEDLENRECYFTLSFLHQLFTCRAPVDCNRDGILEIPYMWHWINPNPRHAILRRSSGERLVKELPPPRFSRYRSFADIDRVPSLYLEDLVTAEPQYEHPECGPMYTFGWCSEREMSFCALARLFGYEGWVRQVGNHVWSIFPVRWRMPNGEMKELLLEFDNTYDIFGGKELPPGRSFRQWWREQEITDEQRWYNSRARDPGELERVRRIQVPTEAQRRIRAQVHSALRVPVRDH